MTPQQAETTALLALGWLAGNDELLPVFLGASGADMATLRAQATEPGMLLAVLDFIVMDDAWVLDCAAALDLPPEALARAREALPGGAQTHWT